MLRDQMRVDTKVRPVLINDHPLNPRSAREKSTEIMFESFSVPGFFIASSPTLCLYASGRQTGCVLESGYGATHAVPIYEGYTLSHAVQRLEIAGMDVTNALIKQLKLNADYARVYGSSTQPGSSERETVV